MNIYALVLACSACAHLRAAPSEIDTVHVSDRIFQIRYSPEDAGAAGLLKLALPDAVAAAEHWGSFSARVLITIHPTHQSLESAIHHEGNGWLVAWARYASVDLESPRRWNGSDAELRQVLVHELTHCVMYQSVGPHPNTRSGSIPPWFREGMASVTAGQEHRRVSTDVIWRFYRDHTAGDGAPPVRDPLAASEPLRPLDPDLVYATAHEAFQFLLELHGERQVRLVLATMRDGTEFADAFERVLGVRLHDFERDFRRHAVAKATDLGQNVSPPDLVAHARTSEAVVR